MGESMPWALRNYAFLGDGERGALVGPRGEVVWLCAPGWDSEAVFSQLIGGAGEYVIRPEDDWHVWGGSYEDGSLVHVSRWVGPDTVIECREALALPAEPERLVLLRQVRTRRAPSGGARVRLLLDARPGFGSAGMEGPYAEGPHTEGPHAEGPCEGEGLWTAAGGGLRLRCAGVPEARAEGGALRAAFTLREGEHRDIVVEIATERAAAQAHPGSLDAARLWRQTEQEWREAVPDCGELLAPRDARQAYAVLYGLTSAAGGMAAAATTSLPERANTGRNYDYRYAWLRDQCYAGIAVAAHGPHPLLDRAVAFVTARVLADRERLRPAYTVTGGPVPAERTLSLPGYPGGSDRVGNRAGEQFQLDTYGEVLQFFAAAARHGHLDNPEARDAVRAAVTAVEQNWELPDAGLWELEERWWTHSRLSVVTGLQALVPRMPGPDAERMRALADTVLDETRRRCLRPDGVWGRAADDTGVDASLLLPLARGCLPRDHPSVARTVRAVESELSEDGFLYRFRHDDLPLAEAEGAFLLCGFTMALAARHLGDREAALRWFERSRAAHGPPGLYAEEFDVVQRQLRGNLPQGFVHAVLLESATLLAR
ncbi:glycoside hydrolase family 15 protein [Streptomyces iconiensis]|uniref:Glycoside hydrolase family 15 protein n=1 Tax=Streptomyces iconiensis TaxID=1384038 RepID=A0ABT6ZZP6_9ACTN|nr:glycoside hydrolase family 15 protein [Streptomyces iconiensis]MDJ1134553.1 glycoside hydrolase family 15 protein [Streptomyces iconiensis]